MVIIDESFRMRKVEVVTSFKILSYHLPWRRRKRRTWITIPNSRLGFEMSTP